MTSILPPVETTPVLLMQFTETASPQLMDCVVERLEEGGLLIVVKEGNILGLSCPPEQLQAEAEHVRLVKRKTDSDIMENFVVRDKDKYLDPDQGFWKDADGLFTANERCILVWSLMDDITVLPPEQVSSNLSRLLDQLNIGYRLKDGQQHTATLRHVLAKHDLAHVTPVHIPHIRNRILQQTMRSLHVPVHEIRDYYGEEITFYFAWMDFWTRWLVVPAFFGVITLAQRWYRGDTVDEDEYTPFYGLICFLWAILGCRFWQRQEHKLAYSWGTYAQSEYERKGCSVRPQFHGRLRKSPITGAMETYYPPSRRRVKYVISALIMVMLLGVAFCVMILSLNLQGYINPKRDPERWNNTTVHPFHYPVFSALAEENQIFDAASTFGSWIPVVLHVACIFSMNWTFRKVAQRLTDWENHETQFGHKNSLLLKRFLFEAFDCYVALFYLAFYERNVDRLRLELIAVFNIDTFRRLLLECIVPMFFQKLFPHYQNSAKNGKDDPQRSSYAPLLADANLDDYEQFDDYMEIVIQLGYVTLFASAYPLASLVAIVANLVEIRADCFKLTRVCRRPRPMRTDGCGMWNSLVSSITWLSALTNCLIFGFTSDQLMQYLPSFYYLNDYGHTRLAEGKGWIVIFIIFGVERLLVYAGLLMYWVIPEVPETVMEQLERRHYVRTVESKKAKGRRRMSSEVTATALR
jgi:hypothetical protein